MTEVEHKAREAWAAMLVRDSVFSRAGLRPGPMPADLAIDMVQDVTGDRDDAAGAIIGAGADWLANQTQPGGGTETDVGCSAAANNAIGSLRAESLGTAALFLGHVRTLCDRVLKESSLFPAPRPEVYAALRWERWLAKAERALALCNAVADVAWPLPAQQESR
jgi:hypothetical protein